ncbi:MAG: cytochrome b N-terminal domain-containing protein [Candidatus Melainabacteria bacterium]|nr:cytochrome b N-terminal domain-containing protein [Candidatus Melainabacteria bacterium]
MYTQPLNKVTLALEQWINAVVTSKYNPLYYHGALPQFFLWVLFLSGLLLFAYYVPTIDNAYSAEKLINAYTTVEYITHIPFGATIRGIHRYAGDAMVIAILLHMLRVWFTDRYRQYRIVQWLSGIVLLLLVLFIGQTGYYLVWDERSLALTRMTAKSFDVLPIIGEPLKWWFLNGQEITNYTLSNFLFIHIGLSFSLLFGLWIHYVRMQRPVLTPPPVIQFMLFALLSILLLWYPVTSGSMATLTQQPTAFEVDWFFLWPYWLMTQMNLQAYWLTIVTGVIVLCMLPYFVHTKEVEAAEVVTKKCTGCSLCSRDCPYAAIEMVPAPAGSRFKLLATVKSYRCSGCGVCVGACAFDAIDLPNLLDTDLTAKITASAKG